MGGGSNDFVGFLLPFVCGAGEFRFFIGGGGGGPDGKTWKGMPIASDPIEGGGGGAGGPDPAGDCTLGELLPFELF